MTETTNAPELQKPIMIDAKNWTGDDDNQVLPSRLTKDPRDQQAYDAERAKWSFLMVIPMALFGLAVALVSALLRLLP